MTSKKKIVVCLCLIVISALMLTACGSSEKGNRVTYGKDVQTFTYAYVRLGDKDIVEGYITQWRDYDNSDTIQLMINGKYYLTHYSCVVMVADPAHGTLDYSGEAYQDHGHYGR